MSIDETRFAWIYPTLVGAALVLLLAVPTARAVPVAERQKYYGLQLITLFGAAAGAKVSMLMGDLGWPVTPLAGGWYELLHSGRSITGGLLGGFLAAEAAKPLVGYNAPPNDAFAAKLPFSIALGRVGCLLGGCCRGIPQEGPFSLTYSDGVPRFPAQLVELVFQLGIGVTFVWMVRRRVLAGRVFALYLIVYGLFRFVTEPLRETPKPLAGMSVYQGLAVLMVLLGAISLAARSNVASKREVAT